jgi:predicted anti-sigma-YlaC factor YlaD
VTEATCRVVRPLLSAFRDGDLTAADADSVQRHLETCEECRGLANDLERLVQAAHGLEPVAPSSSVWQAIARRTGQETLRTTPDRGRQRLAAAWQWAGLSAALLAITTIAYLASGTAPGTPVDPQIPAAVVVDSEQGSASEPAAETDPVNEAIGQYERAIVVLQDAAASATDTIGPAARTALAEEGAAFDRAIAESRAAVAADPDDESARLSLFEALRRKVSMLQATVTLINEMNEGDPAGAARASEGLGRKSS